MQQTSSLISRRKSGKQYHYYDNDGKRISDQRVIERINKLAIPPAWKKVQIAPSGRAKLQATGYDSAGRKQSIYHPTFRLKQDAQKFERILRFAKALPKLRAKASRDMNKRTLSRDKVLALIVTLMDQAYFRVGNEISAKEQGTYGITTLRSKHVDVTTTTVTFDFTGKSGQHQHKEINDRKIAQIIKQLDESPGYELFNFIDSEGQRQNISASDVNTYIKDAMGEEFTAKDFRTWGGTLLATSAVLKANIDKEAGKTELKKTMTTIVKSVAKRLGNTPAIARSSYIDPRVISAFDNKETLPKLKHAMTKMKPRKYMTVEEQCVMKLLRPKASR